MVGLGGGGFGRGEGEGSDCVVKRNILQVGWEERGLCLQFVW